jgi:hypothetical protein
VILLRQHRSTLHLRHLRATLVEQVEQSVPNLHTSI